MGGGAGAIAYYATLALLTRVFGIWYIVSIMAAWAINWGINFTIQKFWTFRNLDSKSARHQFILYFTMAVGFLAINTSAMYALVEWGKLRVFVAQPILTILITIASYFITRKIFTSPAL